MYKRQRELRAMRRNLREMVANIDTASQQITGNVDGLKQVTETVDHMCSDNSATSQQLAAGMQETAACLLYTSYFPWFPGTDRGRRGACG